MLIEIKHVKGILLTTFLLLIAIVCAAQQTQPVDTVDIKPFERYWTKSRVVPKVGFGVQETGFGEIGVQLHRIYVHPLSLASTGPYFTVDGVFQRDEIIIGPKIGYELTAGLFGVAADITYYTDFDKESVMVTPKAGLSLLGYVNLFYGRNLQVSDYNFSAISPNRISIIFNLNRDYSHIRDAGKRTSRSKK